MQTMTEKLISNRIIIRIFTKELLSEKYVSWLNDKEVTKYSEQRHCVHSYETCKDYFESFIDSDNIFFAIINRKNSEHIGSISVTMDINNKIADVAIMIGEKEYWGQGFGKEAWSMVVQKLLSMHEIRKVTAGTMSINYPMLKLIKDSGMVVECTKKFHFLYNGEEVDIIYASIFSKAYSQ